MRFEVWPRAIREGEGEEHVAGAVLEKGYVLVRILMRTKT